MSSAATRSGPGDGWNSRPTRRSRAARTRPPPTVLSTSRCPQYAVPPRWARCIGGDVEPVGPPVRRTDGQHVSCRPGDRGRTRARDRAPDQHHAPARPPLVNRGGGLRSGCRDDRLNSPTLKLADPVFAPLEPVAAPVPGSPHGSTNMLLSLSSFVFSVPRWELTCADCSAAQSLD